MSYSLRTINRRVDNSKEGVFDGIERNVILGNTYHEAFKNNVSKKAWDKILSHLKCLHINSISVVGVIYNEGGDIFPIYDSHDAYIVNENGDTYKVLRRLKF